MYRDKTKTNCDKHVTALDESPNTPTVHEKLSSISENDEVD